LNKNQHFLPVEAKNKHSLEKKWENALYFGRQTMYTKNGCDKADKLGGRKYGI